MPPTHLPNDETVYLKDQLTTVKDEFNDFTYAVSHDLGTPLRAIVNFSKLLAERHQNDFNEKDKRYLQFITEGGEKLQAMMAGLLTLSRLNTQAKPPQPLETSVVVGRCHATLKEKITASKGSIRVQGTLPSIVADADQCFQLFLTLIDNALTYRAPDVTPQIQISAIDTGNAWKFLVEDNGIGVPPDQSGRVFQVFKRLHTDEEYPGIGMGLALAKKIVERHGGDIGITPRKSGGTVVWFTFAKTLPETTAFLSFKQTGRRHE